MSKHSVPFVFLSYRTGAEALFIWLLCMMVRILRVPAWCYVMFWIESTGGISNVQYGLPMRSRYEIDLPRVMRLWLLDPLTLPVCGVVLLLLLWRLVK